MNEITIGSSPVSVKEYKGNRVVTFKDIDAVHGRTDGTASRNFRKNREHFIEGEDFFNVCADEIRRNKIMDISPKVHNDVILITETGYLMLAKSFTDELSWNIQRELVNSYFKGKTAHAPELERERIFEITPDIRNDISAAKEYITVLKVMLDRLESNQYRSDDYAYIAVDVMRLASELYDKVKGLPLKVLEVRKR